jgi:uncharacterized protein (TIGR02246 family)
MRRRAVLRAGFVAAVFAILWSADRAPAEEPFDRAARTEELRRTELAFAATVREDKPDAFATLIAEDAVFLGSTRVLKGRAAIAEAWQGYFGQGRPDFEWHPETVELSGDGELGVTRGPWVIRSRDKDGKAVEESGTFNSTWRRQADGSWRILFDAGCVPCRCGQ